jgi:hypothetical protein
MSGPDHISPEVKRPRKPLPTTPINRRKFTDIWCNTSMPARDMAVLFDRGPNHIYVMARRWNLPPRTHLKHKWPRKLGRENHPLIGQMWDAGVLGREMAEYFGLSTVSMRRIFRDLGKPPRPQGFRAKMTLADFLTGRIVQAMARDAEHAALRMRVAGMADRNVGRPSQTERAAHG